jgi:hypothetical protein
MPTVSGDRFSSQNMADCEFCPPEGRRFRTARQCAKCSRYLCLVCRPYVPQRSVLCPDCGGGPCDNAFMAPAAAVERITAAGLTAPFWLTVLQERIGAAAAAEVEELIIPE